MRLLLVLALCAGILAAQKPAPLIVDTDIGDDIDDALALALVLQSPEVDLKLVTTVADDVDSRTRLVWKELGVYGRQDIPLATGASEPLLDPSYPDHPAQFKILTPQDQAPPAAHRNGAEAIVDTLLGSNEKITILAIGPLTNIALALKLEPRIKPKIARVVLMGGAYFRQKREYNIGRDRAAAAIVFGSGLPITAVGLDVTEYFRLESQDVERIHAAKNAGSEFLSRLIDLWQEGDGAKLPVLYDPVAAGAALKPSLLQTMTGSVAVEMRDPASFGVTHFTQGEGEHKSLTDVARGVNAEDFLGMFMDRLTSPPRGR